MLRKVTGSDGKTITIPNGYRAVQGSDGHMVKVPPGARAVQGSDGRMAAIPAEHRALHCLLHAGRRRRLEVGDHLLMVVGQTWKERTGGRPV